MQPQEGPLATRCFNDQIAVQHQIYEPLTLITKADIKRQLLNTTHNQNFAPLFCQSSNINPQGIVFKEQLYKRENVRVQLQKDLNIIKIIQNQKEKSSKASSSSKSSNTLRNGDFSFNFDTFMTFIQTPIFKQQLLSPLSKFCRTFKYKMVQLYKLTNKKDRFKQTPISPSADPTLYTNQIAFFFTGLAVSFRNKGCIIQSLFFYHLGIFCQPFNVKIWEQYCQTLKKIGYWKRAKDIIKTAFLFNPNSDLAQSYFVYGDKANAPAHEMRGLLCSLKQPEKFQKAIIQSSKYQLKHRKIYRGFLLLSYFCEAEQYKSNISQAVILLAKFLQFFKLQQLAMKILSKSIDQKHSKYEAFTLYLQLLLRKYEGNLSENNIQFDQFIKNIKKLAPQTRYRICLDIAEAMKNNIKLRKKFYQKAVQFGYDNCQQVVNQKRVRRHIYMSILSNLCLKPKKELLTQYRYDDHMKFLLNKAKYIRGEPLEQIQFQDWKYYLHYALGQDLQIILKAYKAFNQGRIFAQFLHALRLRNIKQKRSSISVLKLWRDKIGQAPKSGELWCEGGRIYIQLGQNQNAKKCFLAAIHFTPQYGDSFFQLLKIFLFQNNFVEINQLRKSFLMSEPFYGNVFSFLRLSKKVTLKLSLIQIWNECEKCIKQQFYRGKFLFDEREARNQKQRQKYLFKKEKQIEDQDFIRCLTACELYNSSFGNPSGAQIRQKLFLSYELIQNKFSK